MKKLILFSMIAGLALIIAGLCAAIEIVTEAELANTIEAPMAIGVPGDGSANGGTDAVDASRGNFVWVPGAPLLGGGGEGFMQFEINIPVAGTYAVWARIIAWDGNSDSFWVTWEPADPPENSQETDNKDFRWSMSNGSEWHWDRIERWADDDSHTDREWVLPAGPTALTIYTREDAAMIDSIFITDNLSSDEAVANPRVPTDDDLNVSAVSPVSKLAVTWGAIREAQ